MPETLEYYLKLNYTELIKEGEDGIFFGEIAELPGCWAEGTTPEEARKILTEAKRLWIETQLEDKQPIPEPRYNEIHKASIAPSGNSVLVWLSTGVDTKLANEAKQIVFSDSTCTYNMADRATDFIEYPSESPAKSLPENSKAFA